MSNSYKKTPIVGITTAASEKEDKRIWHRRMRSRQRDAMTVIDENWEGDDPNIHQNEVSNPWSMGKDGRQYLSQEALERIASRDAQSGQTPHEKEALKERSLAKLRAK